MKIIALIITISFFVTSQANAVNLNGKASIRVPLIGVDKDRLESALIAEIINDLPVFEDEWQALEKAISLKTNPATASLFNDLNHAGIMLVFSVAGKLPEDKKQQAQWLASAYDFYLREDVKSVIDELNTLDDKDEWQVLEQVVSLKTNTATTDLFNDLAYVSMILVFIAAGKLPKDQQQQTQRLASAYDFYLKKDIKSVIDELDVFTDEWQVLEHAISLKTDPATASLFNDESYSDMVNIFIDAGKWLRDKKQQAQRLAGAYDFYLREDIKPVIDVLSAITDELDSQEKIKSFEWVALEKAISLKTNPITTSLFDDRAYASMILVFTAAGKLPKDKQQQAQWLASAYDFYLREDVKSVIDELDTSIDGWDSLEKIKSLKTDPATADLFNDWAYASMTLVFTVAGKLSKDKWQQAQWLASAYDFYLREGIKVVIDKLPVGTNDEDGWVALEKIKSLKTDLSIANLFNDRAYASMVRVLSVAGKLSRNKEQQAQRLASAYDFYLREDIKPVIDKLDSLEDKDKWYVLEQVKSLKTDPATADLFNDRGYSSMMEVFSVAGKLPKDKLPLAQRLAGAYDFYLKKDIKPVIDELPVGTDENEWDALGKVKSLKTDPATASLFNNWGYGTMMDVLCVAGKLSKDKLQRSILTGGAADYFFKRKEIITNLFVKTYQDLDDEDKRALLEDLKTWDHKSRSKSREFRGIGSFMRLLLKPEHERLFPYLKDITKPIAEQKFLAKATRREYLIVTLSLMSSEEFLALVSSDTPSSISKESGIFDALKRKPATAL